jgi:hypothetical protein
MNRSLKVSATVLRAGFAGLLLLLIVRGLMCPEDVFIDLGKFADQGAGERAAIQRLARQVKRCGTTQEFRVMWAVPAGPPGPGILLYSRRYHDAHQGTIGFEGDLYSGFIKLIDIDEAEIQKVAQRNGVLEDFTALPSSEKKNANKGEP